MAKFNAQNMARTILSAGRAPSNVIASARAVVGGQPNAMDQRILANYAAMQQQTPQNQNQPGQPQASANGQPQQSTWRTQPGVNMAQTIQNLGKDVQALARSPIGKQVAQTIGKVLGGGAVDALKGVGGMMGGAAGMLGPIAKVAQAIYHGVRIAEAFGGMESGEKLRGLRRDARTAEAEGTRVSAEARQLANMRVEEERVARTWGTIPVFGASIGNVLNRGRSVEIAKKEIQQSMYGKGHFGAGSSAVFDAAAHRLNVDESGQLFGKLSDALHGAIGYSPSEAKEIRGKAEEMMGTADQLKKLMFARAEEGDFGAAAKHGKESNDELNGAWMWAWVRPQEIFVNADNARGAARVFPMTQQMRRLRSYE